MTHEEVLKFENKLKEKGYRKITSAKAEQADDYEWYKAFYGNDGRTLYYQVFFCFWDWDKYKDPAGWSISIVIIPDSCRGNVGRRDLHISSLSWNTNIEKVEKCAQKFYNFIRNIDSM